MVESCYERTKELLNKKKKELEILANELLKKEIIFQSDLERLIGKRPFSKPTTYEAYTKSEVTDEKDEVDKELSSKEKSSLRTDKEAENQVKMEEPDEVEEVTKSEKSQ